MERKGGGRVERKDDASGGQIQSGKTRCHSVAASTEKESVDAGRDVLDVDTNDEPSTVRPPIARAQSCFSRRAGTPRQGGALVRSARCVLHLIWNLSLREAWKDSTSTRTRG